MKGIPVISHDLGYWRTVPETLWCQMYGQYARVAFVSWHTRGGTKIPCPCVSIVPSFMKRGKAALPSRRKDTPTIEPFPRAGQRLIYERELPWLRKQYQQHWGKPSPWSHWFRLLQPWRKRRSNAGRKFPPHPILHASQTKDAVATRTW